MSDIVTPQKIPEVLWWEKHVEYTFVLNASHDCNLDLLSPLAGPAEAISDAIVGNNSKYFIIEFKRTLEHFKDEYKKFLKRKKRHRRSLSRIIEKKINVISLHYCR
ncbi:hypothetical protein [Pectobacterium parmentieri]|uniref:Uncharacterized protein n=1 Tax=Pectobacterium parmentieri TaxID=1905730 RepID=A0A0H3I111_PECPM|nr:hypothetical protein [Pectobacterium parmentieri]AFI89385.1 Hypothetical protein W5S_1284 [Pectobacterium parmentieri]